MPVSPSSHFDAHKMGSRIARFSCREFVRRLGLGAGAVSGGLFSSSSHFATCWTASRAVRPPSASRPVLWSDTKGRFPGAILIAVSFRCPRDDASGTGITRPFQYPRQRSASERLSARMLFSSLSRFVVRAIVHHAMRCREREMKLVRRTGAVGVGHDGRSRGRILRSSGCGSTLASLTTLTRGPSPDDGLCRASFVADEGGGRIYKEQVCPPAVRGVRRRSL